MRLTHSSILVLMFASCAFYAAGEWWAADYYRQVAQAREAHDYHRTLFIIGVPAASLGLRRDREGDASTQAEPSTQLLSAATRHWLIGRNDVEALHVVSAQVWAATLGERTVARMAIYGIDPATAAAFRLGDPQLLETGALVLAAGSVAALGVDRGVADRRLRLDTPEVVLAQLPRELAEQLRAVRPMLPLAPGTFVDPPGLRSDRPVAYVHRDADRLGAMLRPADEYIVLLRPGTVPEDARAEIASFLAQYEVESAAGVVPVVKTMDEHFPPLIPLGELGRWMTRIRVGLVVGLLVVGLSLAWLRLRQHAFEMALRRALGSTRGKAFVAVYGPWLGGLLLASTTGAGLVWLASVASGFWQHLPLSVAVFAAACGAMILGTLAVARRALLRDPLQELAHGQ